jgi:hypothetical protein
VGRFLTSVTVRRCDTGSVIAGVGEAPCQCRSPGANRTMSPAQISSIGPRRVARVRNPP